MSGGAVTAAATARWSAAASAASLPLVIRASHATEVDSGHRPVSFNYSARDHHRHRHRTRTKARTATPTGPPPARRTVAPYKNKARSDESQNEAHLTLITPNLIRSRL
ncbi:unnamed protein product [Colias eurytheme]|nr:unnamed protein product [Colias eurytheme]